MSRLISILSTEHGRLRREERDIDKRDLQKALKYGTRERNFKGRWKIEHDGVIFIVNESMTYEVTAFPSPLALASVDIKDTIEHDRTRHLLLLKPELCTSHTILVVDNSGSMTTHDINLHRDRQVAAYSVTALEFVAEQLFKQTATNSDIVTLIEFDKIAREVITKEPITWELYNKLLSRRDRRGFVARQGESLNDISHGNSNYLPALEAADKALNYINHDRCALSLLFLSDGAPTDAQTLNLTPMAANNEMAEKINGMAQNFKEKLNIQMIAFGSSYQDFSVLENLVDAALSANSGTKAEFTYCDKVADKIGSAVSNLVSSTTETRTQLLQSDRNKTRTKRSVEMENDLNTKWNYYKIINHNVYDRRCDSFRYNAGLPPGAVLGGEISHSNENRKHPPFLVMNRHPCGKGAERLAFRCHLSRSQYGEHFVFNEMVAKETNLVERPDDNVKFHEDFCKSQDLAGCLAGEFNMRTAALPWYHKDKTPNIFFLPCSILILDDPQWPGRGVLVEKKLNTEKYGWRKYNDNSGGVNGKYYHPPLDLEREFAKIRLTEQISMGNIIEEGSEDSSDNEDQSDDESIISTSESTSNSSDELDPTYYIQAFTHFTYLFTNKQAMVCDLQGVFNTDTVPPLFELTDPAIHYKSKRDNKNVFGRTDLGREGMDLFFKTHKCNQVCKVMQLTRKNNDWKKKWRNYVR